MSSYLLFNMTALRLVKFNQTVHFSQSSIVLLLLFILLTLSDNMRRCCLQKCDIIDNGFPIDFSQFSIIDCQMMIALMLYSKRRSYDALCSGCGVLTDRCRQWYWYLCEWVVNQTISKLLKYTKLLDIIFSSIWVIFLC